MREASRMIAKYIAVVIAGLTITLTAHCGSAYAWTATGSPTEVVVSPAATEVYRLALTESSGNLNITDSAGNALTGALPPGCSQPLPERLSCPAASIAVVRVTGGSGDDQLADSSGVPLVELNGGDGGDLLSGGQGTDHLNGGAGTDQLNGGSGNDVLSGGADADQLFGVDGNDTLDGGSANDNLLGGDGVDVLDGADGNDVLDGGNESDTLTGAAGNDTLDGGSGADQLTGAEGDDTIGGGLGEDDLSGGPGADDLTGGAGADRLNGADGNDLLAGGDDADIVTGAAGDDDLRGGAGADDLRGDAGNDTLQGAEDSDQLRGGEGDDDLNGGTSSDLLRGDAGRDVLRGDEGNDDLDGGAGDDNLFEGAGADAVHGGDGQDTVSYGDRLEPVAVTLDGLANDGGAGEDDNIAGDNEAIIGGGGNDRLVAGSAGARLDGAAGNDEVIGGVAADQLGGGEGDDLLDGGPGGDLLDGGGGFDTATYAARTTGVRVVLDRLAGDGEPGEGDDVRTEAVLGGSGPDLFEDAPDESNTYSGGPGNDRFQARNGSATFTSDQILCGTGDDEADLDGVDSYNSDCESVFQDGVRTVPPPFIAQREVVGATAPRLRLVNRRVRMRAGKLQLRLQCRATQACRSRVRISSLAQRITTRTIRILPGRTRALTVRPFARMRRALTRAGRTGIRVTVTASTTAGTAPRTRQTLRCTAFVDRKSSGAQRPESRPG